MSLDHFFTRQYHEGSYNCAHFVAEVWESLTGVDIRGSLNGFLLPPKDRFVGRSVRREFERLEKPKSPCIVLMHTAKGSAHVGLFYLGKVFHIRRAGVFFQPVDIVTMGFKTHRFYDVKNGHSS